MKYKQRPVIIEAVQLTPELALDCLMKRRTVIGDIGLSGNYNPTHTPPSLYSAWANVPTREGNTRANIGDWIIQDANGEFRACKPDIFAATYEAVEEHETVATPNDPKLSDGGAWRGACPTVARTTDAQM